MNKSMGVKSALLAVAFFLSIGAFADGPFVLFERPGVPVVGYNSLVARVQEGESLQFSNGRVWKVERLLGHGEASLIFSSEGKAIRISRFAGLYDKHTAYKDLLNEIIDGNQILRDRLVPVIEVDVEASLRDEYIVQEELFPAVGASRVFSLEDFLNGSAILSPRLVRKVSNDLVTFAVHCAGFRRFGDQSPKQVLYSSKGWRLADYRKNHSLASSSTDPTPFQQGLPSSSVRSMRCADGIASLLFSNSSGDPGVLPLPGNLVDRVQQLSARFRQEKLSL